MISKYLFNNFCFSDIFLLQQFAIELFVHLRELPLLLRADLQLPPTADLGPETGTSHGYLQGPDVLQLPRARLFRDIPSASKGPADEIQRDIPWRGFRHH